MYVCPNFQAIARMKLNLHKKWLQTGFGLQPFYVFIKLLS